MGKAWAFLQVVAKLPLRAVLPQTVAKVRPSANKGALLRKTRPMFRKRRACDLSTRVSRCGREAEEVERVRGLAQGLAGQVEVVGGGSEGSVAQEELDGAQVHVRLEEVGGEAVAQRLITMLIHRPCESVTGTIGSRCS